MKLDDRFIAILTAMVLILGAGAFLQGGEGGLFGNSTTYRAKPDAFTLRAGRVQTLDVLLNDQGVEAIDPSRLTVAQQPNCGGAVALDGAIQYSGSDACSGRVILAYCVPSGDSCERSIVTLNILGGKNPAVAYGAGGGAPVIIESLPFDGSAPGLMAEAKQPARLTLPTNAEVITPHEATQEVRRIAAEQHSPGIELAEGAGAGDSDVTVSNTAARSGRVAFETAALSVPDLADDAGVSLSAPSLSPAAAVPRIAPSGLAVAGLAAPTAPEAGFMRPEPPAPFAPALTDSTPAPVAPAPEETGPAPFVADAAPEQAADTEIAIAAAPAASAEAPVAVARLTLPSAPRPTEDAEPAVAEAPAPVAPSVAPVAAASPAEIGAGPGQETPAPLEIAALKPEAEPVARPAGPVRPAQDEAVAHAPEAQMAAPGVPEAPETTARAEEEEISILASLARSNTVIGATVSAAKALFAPETPELPREIARTVTDTAPRPAEIGTVAALDISKMPLADAAASFELPQHSAAPRPATLPSPVVVAALNQADTALAPQPLPVAPPAPELALPAYPLEGSVDAACEVDLALQVQIGAEIVASLSSPCRPDSSFLVEHAGLVFTALTDGDGVANFVVPALQTNAAVRVTFPDGGTAIDRALVEGMTRMTRVAVVWTDGLDIDLHAREHGAAAGDEGDVWAGNTRNYRLARRMGGGYLTAVGPLSGPGVRAEVYTLFETLRTEAGSVTLDLALASGDCAEEPVIRILRSEAAELVSEKNLRLGAGTCEGTAIAALDAGLSEITLAGRN